MSSIVFANESLVALIASFVDVADGGPFAGVSRICYIPGQRRFFEELHVSLPRTEHSHGTLRRYSAKCAALANAPRLAGYVREVHFYDGVGRRETVCYARFVVQRVDV